MMNENGFGKCQRKLSNDHFNGQLVCYVNQPSNCKDLYTSATNPGSKVSAEACETGKHSLSVIKNSFSVKVIQII